MGCVATKNIQREDSSSNNQSNQNQKVLTIENYHINQQDLVKERSEKISDVYTILETPLGKGAYGEIRKGFHKTTGLCRAIKIVQKRSDDDNQSMMNEVQLVRSLNHPGIIKIYEFYQDAKNFYIVTDLCTGGELFDRIIQQKEFSESAIAEIMQQVFSAISYCHKNNVVHRDIKPENLLFENKKKDSPLKLIDFGTSKKINKNNSKMNQKIGTLEYMAPEIVLESSYTEKCDVYSCGIILYILLFGSSPYRASNLEQLRNYFKDHTTDIDSSKISHDAHNLLKKLLERDPNQRITALQALEHPFIKNCFEESSKNRIVSVNTLNSLKNFKTEQKLQHAMWVFFVDTMAKKSEHEELLQNFKALDLNGDGILTREELIQGYTKSLGDPQMAEKEVNAIMESVDTDGSGSIEYSEFVIATVNRKKLLSNENLEHAFAMFDKDGSGTITADELKSIFGIGNEDENLWKDLISDVDQNTDGEISLFEFKKMMQKFIQKM